MYAIVDLETTGGSPTRDRVIEVALYLFDGVRITDEFSTLINPGIAIPPQITQLTGINAGMVQAAPRFYEVAKKIVDMTEGHIFVAHNVRFDYSFLKREFADLGFNYQRPQLCTVRLARKLIPGLPSYSLGRLCQSLKIPLLNRHRAAGDARATTLLLGHLLEVDRGQPSTGPGALPRPTPNAQKEGKPTKPTVTSALIEGEMRQGMLPPALEKEALLQLPKRPGVYFFHSQGGQVLYVGKSVNLRQRVTSHFQVDLKSEKSLEYKNAIDSITHEETGCELIALLYESHLIKKLDPPYNSAQKRKHYGYALGYWRDVKGYLNLKIDRISKLEDPLYPVTSQLAGKGLLQGLCDRHRLCQRYCSLFKTKGGCFGFHIATCDGACVGLEDPATYNARVEAAISRFRYSHPCFFIVDQGRNEDEHSVVWVQDGHYMGYGYIDRAYAHSLEDLKGCITPLADNKDIQQIIRGYLRRPPLTGRVITYQTADELAQPGSLSW